MKKCPKCGLSMADSARECFDCGFQFPSVMDPASPEPVQASQPVQQPNITVNVTGSNYTTMTSDKKKGTALILCIFLGWLGIHRFYVGKLWTGILYLVTGGLFTIGWIVDIFRIALGSFRDNVGAPLRQ